MIDLRVTKYERQLQYTHLGYTSSPPTLLISGGIAYNTLDYVVVNGRRIYDFLISKGIIAVALPVDMSKEQINNVALFAKGTASGALLSGVSFTLGTLPTSGPERVVQKILMLLFTSKGTQLFTPEIGEGMQNMAGAIQAQEARDIIRNKLTSVVKQILLNQNYSAPKNELLAYIEIKNIQVELDKAKVEIKVVTMANESVLIGVTR